jgi:hypothetical protein
VKAFRAFRSVVESATFFVAAESRWDSRVKLRRVFER